MVPQALSKEHLWFVLWKASGVSEASPGRCQPVADYRLSQPPKTSVPSGVWASGEDGEVTEGVLRAVGGKVVTCAEGPLPKSLGLWQPLSH